MTRAELAALARRVETEEPSRELDAAIWGASGQFGYFEDFMGGDENAPRYTTSLDAAVSLVPEGWHWGVWSNGCALAWCDKPYLHVQANRRSLPPAAALTAAALRALAQEQTDE